MTEAIHNPPQKRTVLNLLQSDSVAWLVLGTTLLITGLIWRNAERNVEQLASQRFDAEVGDVSEAIRHRLQSYELLLHSGRSLFAASDEVSRTDWHQFVASQNLPEHYPGIQGMGYSVMFDAADKAAHEQRIRAEGFPDYAVKPPGDRPRYSAIIYLEPFNWHNQRAFGFDMYSEAVRRQAMDLAIDTGKPTITAKIKLIQETKQDVQPGFLMYVPVYAQGQVLNTVEDKRKHFQGMVYSPFRAKDLFTNITPPSSLQIGFAIFDGDTPSADSLLFQSAAEKLPHPAWQPRLSKQIHLLMHGRNWTIRYNSTPSFERVTASNEPTKIGLMGILADVLLFAVMMSFARQRKRIEKRARQLQEELGQGEQRQRDLFDGSPNGMLLVDGNGTILLANRQMSALFGYSQAELIGGSVDMLLPERLRGQHPAFRQSYNQHAEIRLMNRRPILLGQRKDGSEFPLEIGLSPIQNNDETQILAAIVDVSERKKAEQEVLQARKLLTGTLNSADRFSMITTDANGQITLFSAGAEKMLGYTADELVGKQTSAILHLPQEVISRAEELTRELGTPVEGFAAIVEIPLRQGSESREWHYVRKDGSTLLVNLTVTVIRDENNQPIGYVGVAYDVTEEKQAAAALQAAKLAAEAASQAKSDFLANMSHEIRTPMNAVLGMAHLLDGTPLSALQREYLGMINQSGKALLGVINDILDFSKIEAGKLELNPVAFNLNDMVDTLASFMSVNAANKEIELMIRVATDVPQHLVGDSLRLQQVLNNLSANAIKFTEAGEVALQITQIRRDADQTCLRFAIRDTGIGINEEQRSRLFSPFSQADNSMTRRFGGTGLGLVICKRLVELMGGEIGVSSTLGQGSEFWFTLPLQVQAGAIETALPIANMQTLNVLVVDDHPGSREFIAEICDTLGWQATCRDSGEAALDLLAPDNSQNPQFDLLLVDMKMPGINGLQLAATLRQMAHTCQTPIVLMATAYAREAFLTAAEAPAVDAFLIKPLTSSSLFNAAIEARSKRCEGVETSQTIQSPGRQKLKPVHLLLVEDNPMNQIVARGILEQLGARLDVANNGAEAVQMLRAAPKRYPLVLMDVQMPVMDGYTATRLIREELKLDIPVITVSAGVTQAEREHCMACGMNDFVGKPINVDQLMQVLGRFLPLETATPAEVAAPVVEIAAEPDVLGFTTLSLGTTLANIGGDHSLLRALLQQFQSEAENLVPAVRQLLADGQTRDAARLLHTIKGTAGTLGADTLAVAAKQTELAVKEGHPSQIDDGLQQCTLLISPIVEELKRLLPQMAAQQADAETSNVSELDQDLLRQLVQNLQAQSMAAFDQFELLAPALRQQLGNTQMETLQRAMDQLDYNSALLMLQPLQNS